jgi:hypothetical protein
MSAALSAMPIHGKLGLGAQRLGSVSNRSSDMFEIIPIVTGLIFGVLIWRNTQGRLRLLLSVAAVAASGAMATMLSGEYAESWIFILLDFGEAAFGLAVGFVIAHVLLRAPRTTRAPSSNS